MPFEKKGRKKSKRRGKSLLNRKRRRLDYFRKRQKNNDRDAKSNK